MDDLRLTMPLTWTSVRAARNAATQALAGIPSNVCDSVVVSVGELVENAVKYGEPTHAAPELDVRLSICPSSIVIQVSNGSSSATSRVELEERIAEISRSNDVGALYVARLQQLLDDPGASGKLGLYRVAFEGGFDLRVDCSDDVLTVTGTRPRDRQA